MVIFIEVLLQFELEREMGIEPTIFPLATDCSTTELLPQGAGRGTDPASERLLDAPCESLDLSNNSREATEPVEGIEPPLVARRFTKPLLYH